MCVRIMETAGKLDMNEYNFFLRGGIVRKWGDWPTVELRPVD